MTCGVCHPAAFRPAEKACVYGYVAFDTDRAAAMCLSIPDLHYMGAEHVFADRMAGNVCHRPGFQALRNLLRAGDRLVIDNPKCFGTKPAYQDRNRALIEAMGVEVMELTEEGKGMRHA